MYFTPETLFLIVFVAVAGYLGYRMLRHGGFKAALFGARIEHTVGEVAGEKQGQIKVALKVHALRRDNSERLVGIEFIAKNYASYEMMPVTLSVHQAQQLASLLQNAARMH